MTDNEIIKDCKNCFHYNICLQWSTDPLNNADWCMHFIDENLINRQKAENNDLFYKLEGVMHSVDKWLEGEELEQDEVNRAATMREKTLQIIEKQQAEIERLTEENKKVSAYIGNGWGYVSFLEFVKNQRAEAIKEFAELVYKTLTTEENWGNIKYEWLIDGECNWLKNKLYSLVKEKVGDADA